MVKRLLQILILLPFLLCLSTCDLITALFSMSPFPGYLAQTVATTDMKAPVTEFLGDDYIHWESDVYVLRNPGGREAVFLVVRRDPGGQTVYAFDTSLNLEISQKVDNHNRLHLIEATTGDFVVGDVRFSEGPLPEDPLVVDSTPYPGLGMDFWDRQTFAYSGRNYAVWSSFDWLYCDEYNDSWVWLSPTGGASIDQGEERRLVGLGYEPDFSTYEDPILGAGITPVYLFVFGWDDSGWDEGFLYIIRTAAGEYPNPSYSIDLVADGLPTGKCSPKIRNVEDRYPVFYTRKGVVASTRTRGTFQLLQLDGQRIKNFYITSDDDDETSFDFDINGEYYYLFNENNLRLYKAATGF